jgi:prevent-host-death family protein
MSAKHPANGTTDPVVEASDDLAQLIDRVVESHRPILVARAGEPKAALVSMEDYARLKQDVAPVPQEAKLPWKDWFARQEKFHGEMHASRKGQPLDSEMVDRAWREAREELEERDARHVDLGR